MGEYPDSGHWMDERRFHVFAKTVARYRSKKWLDYSYLERRILEHPTYIEPEHIEGYWSRLCELVRFHGTYPIPTVELDGESRRGFYQRGVKGGKMYEVPVNEVEYYYGASKETLGKAEYF